MSKLRIITDSASDIMEPDRKDLTVLPMTVRFGEKEYLDGVTINHQEFYEKLIESDELPVTSLISPGDFEAAYQKAAEAGEQVLVVTLSGRLSGTYQSACIAAADFEENVRVVDSMNATIGEQILVLYALQLSDQGVELDEIVRTLEQAKKKIHVLGLLDTLEYLKKGGRISKTAAFLGGALSVKPVVTVAEGEVVMLGKARGSRNGNNFLIHEIEKAGGVDFTRPYRLGYTGLDDTLLQKYIHDSERLWKENADSLPVSSIGATIGTHVGPGAIAVAFFAS